MRTVRFVEGETLWPFRRQTPRGDGIIGTTRFLFGASSEPADWLVVLNDVPEGADLRFPRERTLFLSGEPPSVRPFEPAYLAQFGTAVSVDPQLPHPNCLTRAPFLPWHVGIEALNPRGGRWLSFAELEPAPAKSRLCSCITSTADKTPGHRLRLAFVERLRAELGDRIDFFGRGVRPIADKELGLAPYRYHIALENVALPRYWTEKLADPLLRNCFPIYYGAPDITADIDPQSLAAIDIAKPDVAIATIAAILDSDLDSRSAGAVAEAKRRMLWEHNMLARLDALLGELEARGGVVGAPEPVRTESSFYDRPWLERAHLGLKRSLRRLRPRAKADG